MLHEIWQQDEGQSPRQINMFECNIQKKGRTLRAVIGAGVAAAGAYLTASLIALPLTLLGFAMMVGGGFMMFEGLAGWCVVRAMGYDTPI
jgi:hypothetical protein